MPAQPKVTLEKIMELLGFTATVEEHSMEDGILLDVKTEDSGRLIGRQGQTLADLQYIANRRCAQIGINEQYPGAKNPFPWMSEIIDLKKEKNFFETRVTEYQTGGTLSWEDE